MCVSGFNLTGYNSLVNIKKQEGCSLLYSALCIHEITMSLFGSSNKNNEKPTNPSHQRKKSYNSGSESDDEREKSFRGHSDTGKDENTHVRDKRFSEPRTKRTGRESYTYDTNDFSGDNHGRNYGLSSGNSRNYTTYGSDSFITRRGSSGTTR